MLFKNLAALSAVGALTAVAAQSASNESFCDKYTTALLMNNTAANQYTLLTLVVNTVVIGNYTQPNVGVSVPGILANGTVNGTAVSLAKYFTGAVASTNRGGSSGVAVNFLDGGGAAPLQKNMPANDQSSNQYMLLTHLYQFFGALLGCSKMGTDGFPAYQGQASMYEVHKFMALDLAQETYFITQVALAAASFGVAQSDIAAVGTALNSLFTQRCAPATTVIPSQGPAYQAICTDNATCPLSMNASCAAQPSFQEAPAANSSNMGSGSSSGGNSSSGGSTGGSTGGSSGGSTGGMSGSGSGSSAPASGAVKVAASFAGVLGAAALLVLA